MTRRLRLDELRDIVRDELLEWGSEGVDDDRFEDVEPFQAGEILRGVPDWVLRTALRRFVDEVRQHVHRYVVATTNDVDSRRAAMDDVNVALSKFEKETFENLCESLIANVRTV